MSSFYLKWTKNHVHTLYCLRYGLWRMQLLFFILGYFLVFYSPSSPKNENFKKMKKHLKISSFNASAPKIMIMLYCFWDNGMWRMYLLIFILGYCLFTPPPLSPPLTAQKMKFSKKWKKALEISSFYMSALKVMIICYTDLEIWHVTDAIVIFHFRLFFGLLFP